MSDRVLWNQFSDDLVNVSMHDGINSDTVELARYNEPLYDEILARYKNDFLYPSNSKVYEK